VSTYIRNLLLCVTLLLFVGTCAIQTSGQQQRGPSTAEERSRAVQIAKSLRADPTAASVQQDREWLVKWLIEVPDISVKLCSGILGDLGDSKTGYPGALLATMMASQAAYVIENPSKAKDNNAVYLAGLEGALDGYQAIHNKDSNYRLPHLEDLLQNRSEGKLPDYVRSATKKCK
jgi:hypothetical protein